ncbi:hypothetical protein ColLi_12147 [Colletotrichum liriopes]|uniref:Uncharacterized protein n=1 Tax=Colletotrichum liriopes TaxID=708192 RepID=A0AA37GXU3_9PEZI|nr:hypothetical protein ColLi_12147 [Colletotrichum liriopes]
MDEEGKDEGGYFGVSADRGNMQYRKEAIDALPSLRHLLNKEPTPFVSSTAPPLLSPDDEESVLPPAPRPAVTSGTGPLEQHLNTTKYLSRCTNLALGRRCWTWTTTTTKTCHRNSSRTAQRPECALGR